MKKKRLYILAPNDRFNYGDLLFPYILTHYLSRCFDDIVYVSTTKSDLSARGGVQTESYSSLLHVDDTWENHLIVAGGESLCVRWYVILSFVKSWVFFLLKLVRKASRLFGKRTIELFADFIDWFCNVKTYFAFSVGKNELPQFETIVYNALGGTWLLYSDILEKQRVKKILSSIDYITVRDNETSLALSKNGIKCSICPDSAIMMSEVFPEDFLQAHLSLSSSFFNEKYIFFQGNLGTWQGKFEVAAHQIEEISQKTNMKIVLCPIGMALGHSDHIALQHIVRCIYDKTFIHVVKSPNIFDIMWLIKHSQIYVGSSLHGVITAMSFNIPFVSYGGRKQKAYIETWTQNSVCSYDALVPKVLESLGKQGKDNSNKQKEAVIAHFEVMKSIYKYNPKNGRLIR